MRVVIDLDPLRHFRQVKCLGQPAQQLSLRRRLAHLPREAFAGVAGSARDKLRLFPPLRHNDLHLASCLLGQRLGHQVGVVQTMGQQDHARRLPVGVELPDKGLHDLGHILFTSDPWVIIVVAPILVGPEDIHLHTGLPALHMQGHDIRLRSALRVDALRRLHACQRLDPVAQGSGAFKLHRLARGGHLARQRLLHALGPPLQEPPGVGDAGGIGLFRDQPDAGPGTPLDLILQAGPRARLKIAVAAIAQKERPLQLV